MATKRKGARPAAPHRGAARPLLKPRQPQRAARLPRAERERHIIQEAIKFFAEVGFGGDTRELAKRLHVTHPLLFRYFPSKDALIERVYQEVYIGRWNPYWELIIADRSLPIRARMTQFYKLYAKTILAYEWVRLFMFSGLKGADMNRRWFALVGERIVVPLCREIRPQLKYPVRLVAKQLVQAAYLDSARGAEQRLTVIPGARLSYGPLRSKGPFAPSNLVGYDTVCRLDELSTTHGGLNE